MKAIISCLFVLCLVAAVLAEHPRHEQNALSHAKRAVEAFKTSFLRPPFDQYILSVQFTTLEKEKVHHNDIELSHDETWSSFCLDVTVGINNLPADIKSRLPATFWNLKVYYTPADANPLASDSVSSESSEGMMCNQLAYVCPDGSIATRTPDCLFVCGAAPIGGLAYDQVSAVKDAFLTAFASSSLTVSVDTLYGKKVKLTENEKLTDYCLDVTLMRSDSAANYPGVFNGVRVFYYTYLCTQKVCSDGSVVACDQLCTEESRSGGSIVVPLSAIIFIITLSTCCCYLRRRACRAKCAANSTAAAKYTPLETKPQESLYPSQQYEMMQQESQDPQVVMMMPPMMPPMIPVPMMPMPMSPQMAAQMGYPPMSMPPQMAAQMGYPPMMMPNGGFPIMMQAPNGMWFPAPQHPEDA